MPIGCYVNGSRLRTVRGEIAVEDLNVGDMVICSRDGHEVPEPITWIGYRFIDLAKVARREEAAPVLVRRNAIADNQPARDLFLSPEHCLILDGKCIPVKRLVNGGSITNQRDMPTFHYFHIELERHGIVFAEGLPAETYLDTGNRSNFENNPDQVALHPEFEINTESERWKTDACAPLMEDIEEMASLWRRLADRSAAVGYTVSEMQTTNDPGLSLVADGVVIPATRANDETATFVVPAGAKNVSLQSKFLIGSDLTPYEGDGRRLGVALKHMTIRTDNSELDVPADHPGFTTGWHDPEQSASDVWRWSDGNGRLEWDGIVGAAILTVTFFTTGRYPAYDEFLRQAA